MSHHLPTHYNIQIEYALRAHTQIDRLSETRSSSIFSNFIASKASRFALVEHLRVCESRYGEMKIEGERRRESKKLDRSKEILTYVIDFE